MAYIAPSYFQQEQWFEIRKIHRGTTKGVRIINSYGKVKEVFEDGNVVEDPNLFTMI